MCHIDYQAFANDQCMSSADTTQHDNFHEDIYRRDNSCVITGRQREFCDAAHIIPNSKGSKVCPSDLSQSWVVFTFSLVHHFCCS